MTAESQPKLVNKIGNPVVGADFWPRPDIVDGLVDDLANDRGGRRLFALRRIGKTSVSLEVERRLRELDKLLVIRVDVQKVSRFADFLGQVLEQLPKHMKFDHARQYVAESPALKRLLSSAWTRVTGQSADASGGGDFINEFGHASAWSGDIESALRAAGPIVLIVDELPYMLRNMMRGDYKPIDAERFLATLRDWRFNCGVRMLFLGSLGFGQLKRAYGVHVADHIADMSPIKLPALSKDEAVAMVEALARGERQPEWTPELSAAVVEASAETWPIFLQYGFREVVRGKLRDPAKVAAAVEAGVRQALEENFYEQFATRLSRYDDDRRKDQKPARALLRTVVVKHPAPATFDEVDVALASMDALDRRDDLLEALREDDFLLFDTAARTIAPASRLVPIWVRARPWGR
jgi:hypothetical protein